MPPNYVWPLSNSTTPDEMNTSFGPRIDEDRWDFHDGIDLPAPIGTAIHAMRGGKVHHAGPAGSGGFSSRHVVVRVNDPTEGLVYNVYLHLASIDAAVVTGASVTQGQLIGTVGDDDATYPHLHMEFRKGTVKQIGSVHPLSYLPYADTTNFSPPVSDRFNRLDAFMAARLLFGANSKLEGDLRRVEVDLRRGTRVLTTRVVDFDDKSTIVEGKGDPSATSMTSASRDIKSPTWSSTAGRISPTAFSSGVSRSQCDGLLARAIDVGGNVATSEVIAVPNQTAIDEFVDFEDGQLPPAGWATVTSAGGSGTSVSIDASAAHSGTRGLLCIDDSTTEASTQRAGIEYPLPPGRFEWRAEGWFNPTKLELAPVRRCIFSISLAATASALRRASTTTRARFGRGSWQEMRTIRCERGTVPPSIALGSLAQMAIGASAAGDAGDDRRPVSRRRRAHERASPLELGFDGARTIDPARRHRILVVGRRRDDPGR